MSKKAAGLLHANLQAANGELANDPAVSDKVAYQRAYDYLATRIFALQQSSPDDDFSAFMKESFETMTAIISVAI